MTAEIIQFIPRPNPDRERKLAEEAAKILTPFIETTGFTDTAPSEIYTGGVALGNEFPCEMNSGAGIDGLWTDTDPA